MTNRNLLDALGGIGPDLIERAAPRGKRRLGLRGARVKWAAAAAALVVVLGAVSLGMRLWRIAATPEWTDAPYTAEEIANLFPATLEGATNAYTKVYVPDAKYLYVDAIQDDEYLDVYGRTQIISELNEEEFKGFVDGIFPALANSLQINIPYYSIEQDFDGSLSVETEIGAYRLHASQDTDNYFVSLYSDGKILLDGETVQIDQRQSDEEILASIESVRHKLYSIFNVSFPDVKIIREYDSYSDHGAIDVEIYFYDAAAHPLNETAARVRPLSDYLCIRFDNRANYAGDTVSDRVLSVANVWYYQARNDITEEYPLIANAKRISLQDAETLLYNGYVFGGHSCPRCMANQCKVSFRGYDFVELEYVFGFQPQTGQVTVCLPFYAFYKKIGTSENGNTVYAKTYVAAVEVKGYTEYFESQKRYHKSIWE